MLVTLLIVTNGMLCCQAQRYGRFPRRMMRSGKQSLLLSLRDWNKILQQKKATSAQLRPLTNYTRIQTLSPGKIIYPHLPTNVRRTVPARLGAFPVDAPLKAVVFDLDGTLLDSLWAWEHSGSNFVRSQGFEAGDELDEQLVKMSLLDGARLIKERYGLPYELDEIVELTLRPIKNRYLYEIKPMPGIVEVLARLQARGVKMAVATASYKEFAQAALTRLGLADYFEFIITCDEVGIGKTSPKVYEVAAARLGADNTHTLVVEDALHALQTAKQAGFKTAAVEETHSLHQRAQKMQVADYYVLSFEGENTLHK